jgi:hypothetical protein
LVNETVGVLVNNDVGEFVKIVGGIVGFDDVWKLG